MNASGLTRAIVAALWAAGSQAALCSDRLHDFYLAARAKDPAFETARLQSVVTAEKLAQARAGFLPTLGVNASLNHQRGMASFNGADYAQRSVHGSAWTLQLAQPIWRPGLAAAYAQAELQHRRAAHLLKQAEIELILKVSQAFFDLLVASKNASVADTQIKAVEQQLALARRNFEAGLTTVTDVHEAQARLALAQAQRTTAVTERAARAADMERITGQQPRIALHALADAAPGMPESSQLQDWISLALVGHPSVLAQQLALDVAEKEIARVESDQGPTLEATAGYGRNTGTGSMTSPTELASRSRSTQLGLQFKLPLYAGGALRSQVREAIAQRDKAAAELDGARRLLVSQVQQSFTATLNGQLQTQALVEAAHASRAAVSANKVGYRIGTRLNIDVLNAEQQQFVAERDLYKARADTIMQSLKLKAAAARLEEEDLRTISDLLKDE